MLLQGNTFERLRELSSTSFKPKISSRIRFMIQDTIDIMKNNNWVTRNTVIKPKTLNAIEEEFTMASNNNQTVSACTLPPKKSVKYLNPNIQNVIKTTYFECLP